MVAGLLVVAAPNIAHQVTSDDGGWYSGATPDGADAACYEYEMVPGFVGTESRSVYAEATPLRSSGESEMVENSLPPTGNYD